jgi:hypothetical protein
LRTLLKLSLINFIIKSRILHYCLNFDFIGAPLFTFQANLLEGYAIMNNI